MQGLVVVSFPASGAILRAAHGFSNAEYGAIFLPQTALAIVGSLLSGVLARRIGLRTLLRLALVMGAIAEALLASTTVLTPGLAYAAVLTASGFAGLGFGLSAAPLNSYPGILFPARREPALVVMHTLIGAGFSLGPLGCGVVSGAGLWLAFPLALAALAVGLMGAPMPAPAEAAGTTVDAGRAGPDTTEPPPLGSSIFWTMFAAGVVYALCEGTFSNWIVIYLQEERAVDPASAALALSLFWAALVAGRLLVSALVVRVPSKVVWLILPALMAVAFLLLPLAHAAMSGIVLFALAGLACSAFFPLTMGIASARFPAHVPFVSGMLTAALMLGVGIGSFVLGPLRRLLELSSLYRVSAAYPVVLIALVTVVVTAGRRRRTPGTTKGDPS
jgi:fucose permease